MKTTNFKFVLIAILCIAFKSYSQNLIDNTSLNGNLLGKIFNNAYVEVLETKDNYIKIKDKYTAYIDIDANKRYLVISGSYSLNANSKTSDLEKLEFVNKINAEIALIKSSYSSSNNSITYKAYLWIEKGFNDVTLIKMWKSYITALDLAITKDPEKKFL
jgi:hypothetical protein